MNPRPAKFVIQYRIAVKKLLNIFMEVKEKYFDKIRYNLDKLEMLVADEEWTLPKYREMLFLITRELSNK